MKVVLKAVEGLSHFLYWISCLALMSIMVLTVSDVVVRRFTNPIDLTYEVVTFLGGIVIGFSIPQTSINQGHVMMDFLTQKIPIDWQRVFRLITRCLGIALFAIIGFNIISIGNSLHRSGQVSPILEIPEYFFAYGLGVCCFEECLVLLFYDLLQGLKGVKA